MIQNEEEIYNEIVEYYDFADRLSEELNKGDVLSLEDKKKILLPLIEDLRKTGNKLVEQYVSYLKNNKNDQMFHKMKETLNLILQKIDFCRNKVYELYKDKAS